MHTVDFFYKPSISDWHPACLLQEAKALRKQYEALLHRITAHEGSYGFVRKMNS
jgi:hypothetical protein